MSKWYQMLNSKDFHYLLKKKYSRYCWRRETEFPKSERHLWSKQQLCYFKDIFIVERVLAEAKPFHKKKEKFDPKRKKIKKKQVWFDLVQ